MRFRMLYLGAAIAAGIVPASPAGAAPPTFKPLGRQDVLIVPIQHFPTGREKATDCLRPPTTADPATQAAYKADLATWDAYLKTGLVGVRKTAAAWRDFIDKSANQYFRTSSYGQTWFRFRVLRDPATANGWWPARHSLATYCAAWRAGGPGGRPLTGSPGPVRDAIEGILAKAASRDRSLLAYRRVIVLQNLKAHGGVSSRPPGYVYKTSAAETRNLTVSFVNEEADDNWAATTHAHELGHQLGLPDYYGPCADRSSALPACTGHWDIMGPGGRPQLNAYSRIALGFLPGHAGPASVFGQVLSTPVIYSNSALFSLTYRLAPIEADGRLNVPRALKIPFNPWIPGSANGYLAECRRRINDPDIPAEGLVMHDVGEKFKMQPPINTMRNVTDNADGPMSVPGQAFTLNVSSISDGFRFLTVRFNGFVRGDCSVTVTKAATPPPAIPVRPDVPARPTVEPVSYLPNPNGRAAH